MIDIRQVSARHTSSYILKPRYIQRQCCWHSTQSFKYRVHKTPLQFDLTFSRSCTHSYSYSSCSCYIRDHSSRPIMREFFIKCYDQSKCFSKTIMYTGPQIKYRVHKTMETFLILLFHAYALISFILPSRNIITINFMPLKDQTINLLNYE